jgi:ribonuclease D
VRDGDVWLVDPLALPDLSALAPVFADPQPLLVVHAGDNDLAILKRRYGFAFASIFDTSIAARFLGGRSLGLDVLIETYLTVTLPPSRQKDDWSARPLSPAQIEYAAADVSYLFALKDKLIEALQQAGRLAWVTEECAALAAQPAVERVADPDAYLGLKGARDLMPRERAIVRALYDLREQLARAADRPPFKVLSEDILMAVARAAPRDAASLQEIKGVTPRVISRWGPAILSTVDKALALEPEQWPQLERRPRPPFVAAVSRRIDRLRRWRAGATERFGLEPGVLLPNRLIGAIAEAGPSSADDLARVEGIRRWRVEAFGQELVAALDTP